MTTEPLLTIEDLLNECWHRECEKLAMKAEDVLRPFPSYHRKSIEEEICTRRLPVHTAVYFFKSTDVLRYVLYTNQRQAAERVDKFFCPGRRNPKSKGHFPLGLLCMRDDLFPDYDDMLAILLLANKKSSSYDEIVTDAIEACLNVILERSWETKSNKIHVETDPTTMIMVERIKMLMTANPKAGIAVAPRHWYPNSGDQSWMDMNVYHLERTSLLHALLRSDALYLNHNVRLTLTRMFLERDSRVLQFQAHIESQLPLQAAIINADAKVVEEIARVCVGAIEAKNSTYAHSGNSVHLVLTPLVGDRFDDQRAKFDCLCRLSPKSVRVCDNNGQLPLHLLCASHIDQHTIGTEIARRRGTPLSPVDADACLNLLLELYPEGNTPYQHNLSTHSINPVLSTHPINPPY